MEESKTLTVHFINGEEFAFDGCDEDMQRAIERGCSIESHGKTVCINMQNVLYTKLA